MKKLNLLGCVCDLMTGCQNLKGKAVYLDGLFTGKPKNFGKALAKIKQKFNVVGENMSGIPGQRLYSCADGSLLHIHSTGKSLSIGKHIEQPITETVYNKVFPGKLAGIEKGYLDINLGDTLIRDRSINIQKFKPVKIDKTGGALLSYNALGGKQGVQEVMNKATSRKHYHNVKEIPYTQAMSMGLKV